MEKITGKISYTTFFKFENLSKENIKESLSDTKNVEDFNITKGFINISPFEPKRMYSYNIETGLTNTKTSELSIFANVYDSVDIVEVIVNLTFKEASTDDITFLHHILYKGNTIIDDKKSVYDGLNIDGITNRVIKELGIKQESLHKELTTIVELNDCENAATTLQKYENDTNIKKELYGMFVGDEGYKNVPESLVNERIVNIWSSRDFVSFFAFQNKFLIINLINS
ncbi:MAG: hypothetical protein Q4P14_06090, partial [Methanobacteriaceae archaeon]|nr:hypothetical protein [Methanobacteriaceae archaeon]